MLQLCWGYRAALTESCSLLKASWQRRYLWQSTAQTCVPAQSVGRGCCPPNFLERLGSPQPGSWPSLQSEEGREVPGVVVVCWETNHQMRCRQSSEEMQRS